MNQEVTQSRTDAIQRLNNLPLGPNMGPQETIKQVVAFTLARNFSAMAAWVNKSFPISAERDSITDALWEG